MSLISFITSFFEDVDECRTGTHTCSSNGACTNTEGSFTCDCEIGLKWNANSMRCKGKQQNIDTVQRNSKFHIALNTADRRCR